jgi:hypothetical protein
MRHFTVVCVPSFGSFLPDSNIRVHDRVECRCRRRGTPPSRDADCGSQCRSPRLRACAPTRISDWDGMWRIDGLLTQKLTKNGYIVRKTPIDLFRYMRRTYPWSATPERTFPTLCALCADDLVAGNMKKAVLSGESARTTREHIRTKYWQRQIRRIQPPLC